MFIDELKGDIIEAIPDISKAWAELNAMSTLVPLLSKCKIIDRIAPLRLNINSIMIGPPGIGKTLPMFNFTVPILRITEMDLKRQFVAPSRFSTESFITDWLNKQIKKKYVNNEGIITRDEFSGMFQQIRHTDWQSDGMEFLSELYDGNTVTRQTRSGGYVKCDKCYMSVITATTPIFVSRVDPMFFIQGTGNRFIYCYTGAENYTITPLDSTEFFRVDWGQRRDETICKYVDLLIPLYKRLSKLGNLDMYVPEGEPWIKYKEDCDKIWLQKSLEDPIGWDYHPIKRYPELALKLAGIYEISKMISSIPVMPETAICNFSISEENIKRGIDFMKDRTEDFKRIVTLKSMIIKRTEPESMEDEARAFMKPLLLEESGLTSKEWYQRQDVASNHDKIQKLKDICIEKGWVIKIPYLQIPKALRESKEVGTNGFLYRKSG